MHKGSEARQSRKRWLRSCRRWCRKSFPYDWLTTIVRGFILGSEGGKLKAYMGRERTTSSGETVRIRQLRWEWDVEMWRLLFVTLDVTSFSNSWGKEPGTIKVAREVPALGRESACLFPRILAWLATHWKFKMALLESEETWNQTFLQGLSQRYKGAFESRERADWKSIKGLLSHSTSLVFVSPDKPVLQGMGFSCETEGNWSSWAKKWESIAFG